MSHYNRIRKYEQAIKAYLIRQFYEGFPNELESQKKVVNLFYKMVWGNKKKISISLAKDIRMKRVAEDLWKRSKNLASILNGDQKLLLQNEAEYKRRNDEQYGERVGIMLDSQWNKNPEFRSAFLNMINSQNYKNLDFY